MPVDLYVEVCIHDVVTNPCRIEIVYLYRSRQSTVTVTNEGIWEPTGGVLTIKKKCGRFFLRIVDISLTIFK